MVRPAANASGRTGSQSIARPSTLLLEVIHVGHHLGAAQHVHQIVGFFLAQVNCHRHQIRIFGRAYEKVPAAGAAMDHTDSLMFGSGEVVPNPVPG